MVPAGPAIATRSAMEVSLVNAARDMVTVVEVLHTVARLQENVRYVQVGRKAVSQEILQRRSSDRLKR